MSAQNKAEIVGFFFFLRKEPLLPPKGSLQCELCESRHAWVAVVLLWRGQMTMQGAFLSQVTKPGDTVWAPTRQPVPRCCPAGCGARLFHSRAGGLEVEVMFPALQPQLSWGRASPVCMCGREFLLIRPEEAGGLHDLAR